MTAPNPDPKPHDDSVDVNIDQDFKFKLDQEMKLDVETTDTTTSNYNIKVDSPYKSDVHVKIDVYENKNINENHTVNFTETVNKDININLTENVEKDVDVNVWETHVDVHAENIEYGVLHDEDANDIDSSRLLDVGPAAIVKLDDFTARQLGIANSFNGAGNDMQFSVRQSNNLVDNDNLWAPVVGLGVGVDYPPADPQYVYVEGGEAKSGDGIKGDISDSASNNAGNGSVAGSSDASADGVATVEAFTQDIVMGGNTQGNFATLNVTGNDLTNTYNAGDKGGDDHYPSSASSDNGNGGDHGGGGNGGDGGLALRDVTFDDDINDLDSSELLNVEGYAAVWMDDFTFDTTAIGDSFNGEGNDMQFDVGQSNDLVDNDSLYNPTVSLARGSFTQDVDVYGGYATSGNGINGYIGGTANGNGGNGSISGSTSASADAVANVSAFTQNIVMGANLQVNNFTATVVGGDAVTADDITGI